MAWQNIVVVLKNSDDYFNRDVVGASDIDVVWQNVDVVLK